MNRALLSVFITVCVLSGSAQGAPLVVSTLPFDEVAEQEAVFALLKSSLEPLLGRKVIFRAGATYEEVIDSLSKRQTDVAFLGAQAYLEARRRGHARAILRPVRAGRSGYRGQIFVATTSDIKGVSELKGASFAFVDRYSSTGYVMAASVLRDAGLSMNAVKAEFLGSHAAVVRAVADRRVDGGATFEGAESMLEDPKAIRIIATTDPVPGDPLVVRPGLGPKTVSQLRSAFMELATLPEARPFFDHAGIDSLVPVSDSGYDNFARLAGRVLEAR